MKKFLKIISSLIIIALLVGGILVYRRVSFYKRLDATYTESFPDFSTIKAELNERTILLHWKTSFDVDDSQGCVVLNVTYAALLAGMTPTVLVDASATSLLSNDKLVQYNLPERLRKTLALQGGYDLESFPKTYKDFIDYLHENGAQFVMNGSMNLVSGKREKVYQPFDLYPYIRPIAVIEMLDRINDAEHYIAY